MGAGTDCDPICQRVAGSFRDPSGYVFFRGGRVFRAIDEDCHQRLTEAREQGLLRRLSDQGRIVKTSWVEDESLRCSLAAEHSGFAHFLEHEALPMITYPHEWTVSMLADAGVHTLDLQLDLLESGYSLKDATAYNVQFVNGRPQFVDLGSIDRPARLDVWYALGQFSQMFTFPLLLSRYRGWDLRSYFLGNLGGRDAEQVAQAFGRFGKWRPRVLLDVTLPALLSRWADRGTSVRRDLPERSHGRAGAQIFNLRRLRCKIQKLAAGYKPRGVWAGYRQRCNYDDTAERAKQSAVREFLEQTRPRRVLDLGCNTGDYSRLAAATGAQVIAVDSDHDATELLYRQLRATPAAIYPLVADLGNPSPGLGYMNQERSPFLARAGADCVLALALMHHLLVAGNLPLTSICELLCSLSQRDLVLEFVPREEEMFRRLLRFRVDLHDDLNLSRCREVFLSRFHLLKELAIPGSQRTLLFLRKRTDAPRRGSWNQNPQHPAI